LIHSKSGAFDVSQRATNRIGHGGGLAVEIEKDFSILRYECRIVATGFIHAVLKASRNAAHASKINGEVKRL